MTPQPFCEIDAVGLAGRAYGAILNSIYRGVLHQVSTGLIDYGTVTQRFEPGVVALLTKCVQEYATRRRKSQKKIAEETEEAFTKVNAERHEAGLHECKIPKLSAVRRAIKKMDAFYVYCQRRGLDGTEPRHVQSGPKN